MSCCHFATATVVVAVAFPAAAVAGCLQVEEEDLNDLNRRLVGPTGGM